MAFHTETANTYFAVRKPTGELVDLSGSLRSLRIETSQQYIDASAHGTENCAITGPVDIVIYAEFIAYDTLEVLLHDWIADELDTTVRKGSGELRVSTRVTHYTRTVQGFELPLICIEAHADETRVAAVRKVRAVVPQRETVNRKPQRVITYLGN